MNQINKASLIVTACIILFVAFIFISLIRLMFGGSSNDQYNINIIQNNSAAEDLDLQAVGNLVQKAKDAADLEKLINTPNINNLDLDENGKVDYIQVTEYGDANARGFSLTVELEKGDEQEIATIDVVKTGEKADVEVKGNNQIYGNNHYYRSSFGVGDALLLYWLFRPHPPYFSPYGYGYYPASYNSYAYRNTNSYRQSARSSYSNNSKFNKQSSSSIQNKALSPNSNKSSDKIKAPLKNPSQTQKSFQARNPSKKIKSGGFGRSSSSSSRPSVRKSSSSRSGGFFGGK